MPTRAEERRYALDVLYEADMRGVLPTTVLDGRRSLPASDDTEPAFADPHGFTHARRLVEGVQEHQDQIDKLLSTYASGWTLERMPAVDRSALRMGAYEVLWVDDVPDRVAIREVMALVRELSTDDSPHFVNGLLSRIEEIKPTVVGDVPDAADGVAERDGDEPEAAGEPSES